jgi:flagellar basal-body rod modification protein FlgD
MAPISSTSVTSSANGAASATNPPPTSSMDKLASEDTFLQLFTAQLKNQDPLSPADGTQFVSQLAQFSELEQVMNIGQDVSAIRQGVTGTSGSAGTASSQSSGQSTSPASGS